MKNGTTTVANGTPLQGRYALDQFRGAWRHCHQTANYFANIATTSNPNADGYYLCSTVVNELLELVYNHCTPAVDFELSVSTEDDCMTVSLITPQQTSLTAIYHDFQERLSEASAAEVYLHELTRETPHAMLGLLRIVADFDVQVDIQITHKMQLLVHFSPTD